MNKIICCLLISSVSLFGYQKYNGSTTAAVVLVGGIIKAESSVLEKKYKRKDCPVCKGTGWYWSGDGIKKVDCGYCEPETKSESQKVVIHPPAIIKESCPDGICKPKSLKVQ